MNDLIGCIFVDTLWQRQRPFKALESSADVLALVGILYFGTESVP